MNRLLLVILMSWTVSGLLAQKYSNAFLEIGVGARAHGQAGAMVAQADDISAGFWNPAGLAKLETPFEVAAMHAEWFAGVAQYDYLAMGKNLGAKGFAALSLIRLGIDKIPNTLRLIEPDGTINYDNITEFSAADYALMFSYGNHWKKNMAWSYGASAKVIRRVIGPFGGAWGFGLDAGVQYQKEGFTAGFMAKDITTTFNAWTFTLKDEEKDVFNQTGNEIPKSSVEITKPSFILGGGYLLNFGEKWDLHSEVDFVFTTDGQRNVLVSSKSINLAPKIGLETGYKKIAYFRVGLGQFQRIKDDLHPEQKHLIVQPNLGVGLRFKRVKLDYAFNNLNKANNPFYAHIFSLTLDFEKRTPEE